MMFSFSPENECYSHGFPKKVGQTLGANPMDCGLAHLWQRNSLGKGMAFADAFPGELPVSPMQTVPG